VFDERKFIGWKSWKSMNLNLRLHDPSNLICKLGFVRAKYIFIAREFIDVN